MAGISSAGNYVKVNSTGPAANASGANAIAIGSGAQATQSGSIAMGLNSSSTGANSIAIGTGASATGSVAIGAQASASNGGAAYGDGASATGANSAALGPGSSATAANSVALGSGSIANVPNTVSVGAPGNEKRITNVAAGISPTDAVNLSQLQSVATGLGAQIVGVQQQVNNIDRRLRDGVALAMASGGVPSVPTGRKVGVFGNIAGYDGHGAAGFGITGVLYDTQTYSVQASGSFGVGFDTGVVGGRGGVALFW